MTETEIKTNKVLIGAKVDAPVRDAIESIARDEDRTVSNTIARLLETHPAISAQLGEIKSVKVLEKTF